MGKAMERNPALTGVSGEYYVAAELSRRGYLAAITLRNSKGVDIICSNGDATKSVQIQVKTRTGERRSWIMNKKGENYHSKNLFYVFVNLSEDIDIPPIFSIVPSKVVASFIYKGHRKWLKKPRRDGEKHKDSPMRKFKDLNEEYINKWDLLAL
jgi:hypothetical protein